MIHPATELRRADARIGFGVFATAPIPAGTITWVRDPLDQRVSADAVERHSPLLRGALYRYSYRDLDGSFVLCWDYARFNNHSCRPACRTVGDFDIAVRDLAAGDELTLEYATINVPEELECECRQPHCRGVIRRVDVDTHGADWDAEILAAAQRSTRVAQPLGELFDRSSVLTAMMRDARAGKAIALPTCRELVLRDGE